MKKIIVIIIALSLSSSLYAKKGDIIESSNQHVVIKLGFCLFCDYYGVREMGRSYCDKYNKNVYEFSVGSLRGRLLKGSSTKDSQYFVCAKNSSEANDIFYGLNGSFGTIDWQVEEEEEKITVNESRTQKFAELKVFCEKELNFKIGTSENGDCALKIYQTETELAQLGAKENSSDALARQMQLNNSLQLMQQGLNMMNPQPKLRCRNTLTGWACY